MKSDEIYTRTGRNRNIGRVESGSTSTSDAVATFNLVCEILDRRRNREPFEDGGDGKTGLWD